MGEQSPDARIGAIYRDNFDGLTAKIRYRFGSGPPEPEDAVQNGFRRFLSLKNPEEIKDPVSYIYVAALRHMLDHKRRAKVADAYLSEQIALDSENKLEQITPERVLVERERFEILIAAIKKLPKKQQIIVSMNRLEGKSYSDISAETGFSMGSISQNMKIAMSSLAMALERVEWQKRALHFQAGADTPEAIDE